MYFQLTLLNILFALDTILAIQNISKRYGPVQALSNVSFNVPKGSVFGILGPNGSGKTTLLGTILDVLIADGGTYSWFDGIPHDAARRRIGSLLETPNFYHYLSAMDNLEISAALKQKTGADKLKILKQVGLFERKDSKFQTYSLGMKQRLAVGAALLGDPEVLVLDEPTNGLDPAGIAEVRELIINLNKQGITVIIASHLLSEIEKVCSHVALLKRGKLLSSGHVNEVFRSKDEIEVRAGDMNALSALLQRMPGIDNIIAMDGSLLLNCREDIDTENVNEYCQQNGIILSHLFLKKKSLESRFMELTTEQ